MTVLEREREKLELPAHERLRHIWDPVTDAGFCGEPRNGRPIEYNHARENLCLVCLDLWETKYGRRW